MLRQAQHVLFFLLLVGAFISCGGTNSSDGQSDTSSTLEGENELIVSVTFADVSDVTDETVFFEFNTDSDFEEEADITLTSDVDFSGVDGDTELAFDFISLASDTYYVRCFRDVNNNSTFDTGDRFGIFIDDDGDPRALELGDETRRAITITVDQTL